MVLGSILRMRWSIMMLQKRIRECKHEYRIPESIELDLPLLSFSATDKLPKFPSDLIKTIDTLNDHVYAIIFACDYNFYAGCTCV